MFTHSSKHPMRGTKIRIWQDHTVRAWVHATFIGLTRINKTTQVIAHQTGDTKAVILPWLSVQDISRVQAEAQYIEDAPDAAKTIYCPLEGYTCLVDTDT